MKQAKQKNQNNKVAKSKKDISLTNIRWCILVSTKLRLTVMKQRVTKTSIQDQRVCSCNESVKNRREHQ